MVDTLRSGGMERVAVELANALAGGGFDVAVCASREGGPLAGALRPGVELVELGRAWRWDPAGLVRLTGLIRSGRFDVVHSHGRGSAQLVALSRVSGRWRAGHVFHDHLGGGSVSPAPVGLRLAARAGVDAYIGVERSLCHWAAASLGLPAGKVHLIRNGVDLGRFQPRHFEPGAPPGNGDGRLTVAMVAGLRPEKDHPTLLRAVASCQARDRLDVLLVGGLYDAHRPYVEECRALVHSLGLSGQVRLLGTRTDVPAVLAGADFGVLASRVESGPVALLEYMAAGLPYVATRTGEIAAAVSGSGTGILVATGSVAELAAALDEVAAMPARERAEMGRRGRALVAAEFDVVAATRQVADLYRSLVGAARC